MKKEGRYLFTSESVFEGHPDKVCDQISDAVLDAIYDTEGCAVAVEDRQILTALEMLASYEGAFICPEGAATLTAAIALAGEGWIQPDEKVVLLNTGTGLKYPETVDTNPLLLRPDDDLPER